MRPSDASERSMNFHLLKGGITGDVSTVGGLLTLALQAAMCPDSTTYWAEVTG